MKTKTQKEKQANETPSDKFIRVVNPKTVKVIKTLKNISKCIRQKYYDIEQAQVDKIVEGIQKELNELQVSFESRTATKSENKEDIQGLL